MKQTMISTRDLIVALWQKKWLILICAVLCGALALAWTAFFAAPEYETSAVFYVHGENADVLAESAIYLLQTRQTLDEILEHAGKACSRDQLGDMLSAEILGQTPLLKVTVTCADAAQAKQIADAVTQVLPGRLAEVIAGSQMDLVDVPEVPAAAKEPAYLLHILIGLLIGLALPMAMIALWEYWKAAA